LAVEDLVIDSFSGIPPIIITIIILFGYLSIYSYFFHYRTEKNGSKPSRLDYWDRLDSLDKVMLSIIIGGLSLIILTTVLAAFAVSNGLFQGADISQTLTLDAMTLSAVFITVVSLFLLVNIIHSRTRTDKNAREIFRNTVFLLYVMIGITLGSLLFAFGWTIVFGFNLAWGSLILTLFILICLFYLYQILMDGMHFKFYSKFNNKKASPLKWQTVILICATLSFAYYLMIFVTNPPFAKIMPSNTSFEKIIFSGIYPDCFKITCLHGFDVKETITEEFSIDNASRYNWFFLPLSDKLDPSYLFTIQLSNERTGASDVIPAAPTSITLLNQNISYQITDLFSQVPKKYLIFRPMTKEMEAYSIIIHGYKRIEYDDLNMITFSETNGTRLVNDMPSPSSEINFTLENRGDRQIQIKDVRIGPEQTPRLNCTSKLTVNYMLFNLTSMNQTEIYCYERISDQPQQICLGRTLGEYDPIIETDAYGFAFAHIIEIPPKSRIQISTLATCID